MLLGLARCFLVFLCTYITRKLYESSLKHKKIYCIIFIIGILSLLIAFNIPLKIHFTIFTVPNLFLLATIALMTWCCSDNAYYTISIILNF